MSIIRTAIVVAMFVATSSAVLAHERDDKGMDESIAMLYDARDRFVGVVTDAPMGDVSDGGVIMAIKGAPVFVGFARVETPDGSQSASNLRWNGVTPSYSGRGCTGTPYIPYALGPLRPAVIERKGAKAMLRVAKDEPSQFVSVASQAYPADCVDFVGGGSDVGWLIGDSLDLTETYPEPLHIRIEPVNRRTERPTALGASD